MPHPLIIAAAVTAGVGAAIAFEVNIFKPWRDEHWTEGWAEGIKHEWDEFAENVRENFNEISGESQNHHNNNHNHQRIISRRRNSDQQEEMDLRREMDEFSTHEAQVSGLKARFADEFDQTQRGARLRKGKNIVEGSAMEDRLLNAPTLSYHPSSIRSQEDNEALKNNEGQSSYYHPTTQFTHESFSAHNPFASLEVDNNQRLPFVASSSASSHEDIDPAWHSPPSTTLSHNQDNAPIFADWQHHFSPRTTPPHTTASDQGEDESESWTQLNDSRSASPLSPSWSESEHSQTSR